MFTQNVLLSIETTAIIQKTHVHIHSSQVNFDAIINISIDSFSVIRPTYNAAIRFMVASASETPRDMCLNVTVSARGHAQCQSLLSSMGWKNMLYTQEVRVNVLAYPNCISNAYRNPCKLQNDNWHMSPRTQESCDEAQVSLYTEVW
jgi:hypothetical protein